MDKLKRVSRSALIGAGTVVVMTTLFAIVIVPLAITWKLAQSPKDSLNNWRRQTKFPSPG